MTLKTVTSPDQSPLKAQPRMDSDLPAELMQ